MSVSNSVDGSDANPGENNNKKRILVVDDSMVMRTAVKKALKDEYELIEAEDGEQGWNSLNKNQVDLVISDIDMPVMDGYSMICRIRAADQPRISNVPVVVITGTDDELSKERAYACGADDFIVKPIRSAQLVAAIRGHASEPARRSGDPSELVANRENFLIRGKELLLQVQQCDDTLSLIRLDVDNFDDIRRQYGDDTAAELVNWTTNILLTTIRGDDMIGMVGHAKFAIIIHSAGRTGTNILCDRLLARVSAKPFVKDNLSINVTLSIGIAYAEQDRSIALEDIMAFANRRVAEAYARGGNVHIDSAGALPNSVDETVLEVPGIEEALRQIAANSGSCDPYLVDMAKQIMPLLERCNNQFNLDAGELLEALNAKLDDIL